MPESGVLAGRRVVVTRPAEQAGPLVELLRQAGAVPLEAPAIRVLPAEDPQPLAEAAAALARFDWLVCTSANGVRALLDARGDARGDARDDARGDAAWPQDLRIAAVGPATERALQAAGAQVSFTPSTAVAEALARELPIAPGAAVLWPRGDLADGALAERLRERGATVQAPVAYRTVADLALLGLADALRDGRVDAITFASASTVRHVVEGMAAAGVRLAGDEAVRPRIVCIGPVSAAAARECGLVVDAVAEPHDDQGMISALIHAFAARSTAA